jgi:hypothetical protein
MYKKYHRAVRGAALRSSFLLKFIVAKAGNG